MFPYALPTFGEPVGRVGVVYGMWWRRVYGSRRRGSWRRSTGRSRLASSSTRLAYGDWHSERLLVISWNGTPARGLIATKIPPKEPPWPALASYALERYPPHSSSIHRLTSRTSGCRRSTAAFPLWSDSWGDSRWSRCLKLKEKAGARNGISITVAACPTSCARRHGTDFRCMSSQRVRPEPKD